MRLVPPSALALTLACLSLAAQEPATTASGKKVLLYPDGTWKADTGPAAPATGPRTFQKPRAATAKIAINRGRFSLFYNPAKWKLVQEEEGGRTQFEHRNGDGYALILTERLELPLDTLKMAALANARKAAPDAEIVQEEPRTVNGQELLMMKIKGTIKGIRFQYFGYYHAGPEGAVQVLTYTAQNLTGEYEADFQDFLNGLVLAP